MRIKGMGWFDRCKGAARFERSDRQGILIEDQADEDNADCSEKK